MRNQQLKRFPCDSSKRSTVPEPLELSCWDLTSSGAPPVSLACQRAGARPGPHQRIFVAPFCCSAQRRFYVVRL